MAGSSAKFGFGLVTLFAVFALLLTVLEAGFTYFKGCAPSGIAYDRTLGWRLTKNRQWRHSSIGPERMTVEANTNSAGFRDSDHSQTKQPGRKRILFLGDSYTVGMEYPTKSLFTQRFNAALKERDRGNNFDVMNAAIPAWATDQQYLYLKQEGIEYQPDYVILMVAPNDIRESYGKKFFSLDREQLIQNPPKSIPLMDQALWFLANHSCGFHYWQKRSKSAYGSFAGIFRHFPVSFSVGSEHASEKHLFSQDVPGEIDAAKKLFYALVLAIQQLSAEHGAKLLLSIIPTKMEYDGTLNDHRYEPGKVAKELEAFAATHNIPFLNLVTRLASDKTDPLQIFIANEYHLNDAGHAFVAKQLVPFFEANP